MTDWQFLNVNGMNQPGSPAHGGGGGNPLTGYRDILDARRSMATGRTPQAEYPDGYLGNVNSRREDRLLKHIQSRLTQRSYQRGVHKGERIDPQDYYWPETLRPTIALEYQAAGMKWRQPPTAANAMEQINHLGKNHLLKPEELNAVARRVNINDQSVMMNPARRERMSRLLPNWG